MALAVHGRAAVAWVTACERAHSDAYVGAAAIHMRYAFEDDEGVLRTGITGGAAHADGERGATLRRCLSGKTKAFTVLYDDDRSVAVWWLFSA